MSHGATDAAKPCGGYGWTLLGHSFNTGHNNDSQCQGAQTGATDGRLWSGDSSVQSYGREIMKTWLDSHYMLFRFTDELFLLRAGVPNSSQSLSTESHVSRFTAPDSLINDSASLELASYHLPAPPWHHVTLSQDLMQFSQNQLDFFQINNLNTNLKWHLKIVFVARFCWSYPQECTGCNLKLYVKMSGHHTGHVKFLKKCLKRQDTMQNTVSWEVRLVSLWSVFCTIFECIQFISSQASSPHDDCWANITVLAHPSA